MGLYFLSHTLGNKTFFIDVAFASDKIIVFSLDSPEDVCYPGEGSYTAREYRISMGYPVSVMQNLLSNKRNLLA